MTQEVIEGEVVREPGDKQAIVPRPAYQGGIATADELTVDELMEQVGKIQQVMSRAMRNGEHYGVIPGTGSKPTLLKPGAEKLCLVFRLAPAYTTDKTWHEDGHLTVTAICRLTHVTTGNFMAEGEGLCSTKEAKYAYRNAKRQCPNCGEQAIIKGKAEYGGGWVCFKKQGGCGAKFNDNDEAITKQTVGRVGNEDLADSYNTVLKMACKRALVAAVLNGTAASDIFTQDVEEKVQQAPPEDDAPPPADEPISEGPRPKWLAELVTKFGEENVIKAAKTLWPEQADTIWTVDNLRALPAEHHSTFAAAIEDLKK